MNIVISYVDELTGEFKVLSIKKFEVEMYPLGRTEALTIIRDTNKAKNKIDIYCDSFPEAIRFFESCMKKAIDYNSLNLKRDNKY